MSIRITVTKDLGDLWATDEQFARMSKEEIIELIREDIAEFLDMAEWKIESSARPASEEKPESETGGTE